MHYKTLEIEQTIWKRISELEEGNLERIQLEKEREMRYLKMRKFCESYLTLLGSVTLG